MAIHRILVPIDFSKSSDVALRYAFDLARMMGATLTVVHVHPPERHWMPVPAVLADTTTAASVESITRSALDLALARQATRIVPFVPVPVSGEPWKKIV